MGDTRALVSRIRIPDLLATLDPIAVMRRLVPERFVRETPRQITVRAPWREDRNPSMFIDIASGRWYDQGEAIGGHLIEFVQRLYGIPKQDLQPVIEILSQFLPGGSLPSDWVARPIQRSEPPPPRECPAEDCRFSELLIGSYKRDRHAGRMVEIPPGNCPLLMNHGITGEGYVSPLSYSVEAVEYHANPETGSGRGSLAGYKGPVRPTCWYSDFDAKKGATPDPIRAVWDACELADRLIGRGFSEDAIHASFSGNSGVHVIVTDPDLDSLPASEATPSLVREVCSDIAKGLSTFDPAVYGPTQIFRVLGSIHPKTGARKIPLPLNVMDDPRIGNRELLAMAMGRNANV